MILLKQAPDFLKRLLCLSETTKVASQNHPFENTSYFCPIMEGHEHLPFSTRYNPPAFTGDGASVPLMCYQAAFVIHALLGVNYLWMINQARKEDKHGEHTHD